MPPKPRACLTDPSDLLPAAAAAAAAALEGLFSLLFHDASCYGFNSRKYHDSFVLARNAFAAALPPGFDPRASAAAFWHVAIRALRPRPCPLCIAALRAPSGRAGDPEEGAPSERAGEPEEGAPRAAPVFLGAAAAALPPPAFPPRAVPAFPPPAFPPPASPRLRTLPLPPPRRRSSRPRPRPRSRRSTAESWR